MTGDALELVDRYLTEHRPEGLRGLVEFLAIPSVSALSAHRDDVRRAAEFLTGRLQQVGLEGARLMETGGHPAVYAEWLHAPGRPTVLVYGHHDVQPVDPLDLWTSPPFQAVERDGKLYARGAADDKGQVWMHVLAVQALLRATGSLPVNLKMLIEGEEEVGSTHLPALVARHRELLAADAVVISDSSFFAPGVPAIAYGLRGLAALDVHVRGPRRDLHSGEFGGAVANPLHALAELVAGLHAADGRVAVSGFYDGVRPVDAEERLALGRLPFDEAAWLEEAGVPEAFGEPGWSTLERIWARPTLEVNGMWGGFQGEGSKTVIPAEAHCKITCRLVPDQDPARVLEAVRAHLTGRCPSGVQVEVRLSEGSPATLIPRDSEYMRAAARALGRVFDREPVFTRMGGSIGVVPALAREIAQSVVLMGFGLAGDRIHSPNENFDLANYDRGMRAIAAHWLELGSVRSAG